jgi:hypothetical protein
MIEIEATIPLTETPAWAVLERKLIALMERSVEPFLEKYTHPDGRLIWRSGPHGTRDGADDFYESFYNWPALYLLGGTDRLLELGKRQWDATTRLLEEMGHIRREYEVGYDQFHQSESYIYFYLLCMADPSDRTNQDRAQRFAGFYLNEDPEAPNYDPEKRIIRCVHNGSGGPRWLYEEDDEPSYGYAPGMAIYGLPFEDIPGIDAFEDLKDPDKARRMGAAMQERMGKGDAAANLSVCSLIANAFLLTGDAKYRDWLTEYVGAWVERAETNGGLVPDNVGLSGEVGEYVGGRWYGSMYGWTWPHGLHNVGYAALVAGISVWLVTGDERWLDFPRSQIREVMKHGRTIDLREAPMSLKHHWTGQFNALGADGRSWTVPYRYGDSGWTDYQPLTPILPAALWNTCAADEDGAFLDDLREREAYDWRSVSSFRTKEDSGHEQPWLCYLRGENPGYPERILQVALDQVYRRLDFIRDDETDPRDNHIHWWQQLNPVTTEALVQLTLGAPQHVYNGGLLLAPLRYFDADRRRPGLPPDVAALVGAVERDRVSVCLVNLDGHETRRVVIQAGTLGEHRFTSVAASRRQSDYPGTVGAYSAPDLEQDTTSVDVFAGHFAVRLPPGTRIDLEIGLERGAGRASYAFPWDREVAPDPTRLEK